MIGTILDRQKAEHMGLLIRSFRVRARGATIHEHLAHRGRNFDTQEAAKVARSKPSAVQPTRSIVPILYKISEPQSRSPRP